MKVYDLREGKDNERRLLGVLESSDIHHFSAGKKLLNCRLSIMRVTEIYCYQLEPLVFDRTQLREIEKR